MFPESNTLPSSSTTVGENGASPLQPPDGNAAKQLKRKRSNVAPSQRAVYPRKRAVTACMVCRARRTKCDNKKPKCSFCERVGAECVSEAQDFSGFDPASLEIIGRLERIEQALAERNDGWREAPVFQDAEPAAVEPAQAVVPSRRPSYLRPGDIDAVLPQNVQKIVRWPVIAPFLETVSSTDQVPSPLTSITSPAATRQDVSTPGVGLDLSLDHAMALVDSFMANANNKNPIFDDRPLRALVKQSWADNFPWDAQACIALLCCATGAVSMPFPSQDGRNATHHSAVDDALGEDLFTAAQRRLGSVLDRGGLIEAQAYFLSAQYLMCKLRAYDAWRMFLSAVAACQSFPFVTQATFIASQTPGDKTPEEAVYWSAWKSESELRWELGLRDFGSPVIEYPSLFPTLPDNCPPDYLRAWYFYLSEISLWRLHHASAATIQSLASESTRSFLQRLADQFDELEEKVLSWQESLAAPVHIGTLEANAANEDCAERYVLRGHVSNYYELITWPFISALLAVDHTHPFPATPRLCALAAKGLEWHSNRLLINSAGFGYRHHGTWLMQRSSTRSALVLLSAALTPEARALLPQGWQGRVKATMEMLRYWSSDYAPDTATYVELLTKMSAVESQLS